MFKIKIHYIFFSILFICFLLFSNNIFASNIDGSIDSNFKNAFGENLGWLNFGCDNCNVHITDTNITGYIWSKTHGWINLSPSGSGVTNNCSGVLGGKAWSKSLGWLDFSGASIDESGKFIGVTDGLGTKAGRINFSCNNCGVSTDWRQCSLRESPAQVIINSITDNTVPTIGANISVKNEGNINTEYFLEWCVVSDISNACGGGDDIYYSSESKRILPGETWTDNKVATVLNTGDYYFKLVAHYGEGYSPASIPFTAIYQHIDGGVGRQGGELRAGRGEDELLQGGED